MFKVIMITDKCVHIRSATDGLILTKVAFKRIKGRKSRGAKIRKPIDVNVDGYPFIFTRKEWERGKHKASVHEKFLSDLPQVYREEILDKVKMSKRLSKLRALRLKLEADTLKDRDLENKFIRNRVTINESSKRNTR